MTYRNVTPILSHPSAPMPESNTALIRQTVRLLATFFAVLTGSSTLALLFGVLTNASWQYSVLTFIFALTTLFGISLAAGRFSDRQALAAIGTLSGSVNLSMLASSILIERVSIPAALIVILLGLILASSFGFHRNINNWITFSIIASTLVALAGYLIPIEKLNINAVNVVIPVILAILLMVYIALLSLQFIASSIQIRLTTAFIALVIIPLAISSIVQNQFTLNALRSEITDKTHVTAQQVALSIDRFYTSNLEVIKDEAQIEAFSRYLSVDGKGVPNVQVKQELELVLRVLQNRESEERQYLSSYAVLNAQGKNIFDTTDSQIGQIESKNACFIEAFAQNKPAYTPIEFRDGGRSFITFCAPIRDQKRQTVGVLRIQYNGLVLQRLLQNYTGLLGPYSYAILFDEYLLRLADTYTPEQTYTFPYQVTEMQASDLMIKKRLPDQASSSLYNENPDLVRALRSVAQQDENFSLELESSELGEDGLVEIGSIVTMSQLPWKIAYFQAEFDPASFQDAQNRLTAITAALIALVVSFVGIGISRVLSQPLVSLTGVAEQVAGGDLNARAGITSNDETGALARAFNSMTDRLNQFIAELEERVLQRTNDLEFQNRALATRSDQLRTVSDVARGIVTSQELQSLLNSVTHLISERFGFYHVGVFLLDETRENAVLRAANSDGGQKMLARQHKLQVGHTGIVGYATGVGEPRIATDVGTDAIFFNNPDLPATRSEMALPLIVNDRIIGALDVQSTESNAFSPDDIGLFATLADQVAIAIYNNQLYTETARALTEAQNVHRQYLRQEWNRDSTNRRFRAFRYTPQGVMAREVDSPDITSAITTGKPYIESVAIDHDTSRAVMAIPIQLRGETIGVIRVQDQGVDRSWSTDEVQAVQDVAQQVGVALENARLFEKTVQRAEREKKVLEITGLIRSTNDPQQMLEIAAGQIQKALGVTRAQIIIRQSSNSDDGSEKK